MNPRIVLVEDWPQPDTVTPAIVCRTPSKLVVAYGTVDEQAAVLVFQRPAEVKAGGPNDEALNGHPLYKFGLKPYSIHRVDNSPWLDELERRNAVHPQHSQARFRASKVHYVFTLKEETIECMVWEPPGSSVAIEVFKSHHLALRHIKECIDA